MQVLVVISVGATLDFITTLDLYPGLRTDFDVPVFSAGKVCGFMTTLLVIYIREYILFIVSTPFGYKLLDPVVTNAEQRTELMCK